MTGDSPRGLIAGSGSLPERAARRLAEEGDVVVCSLDGEPGEKLRSIASDVAVIEPGQLGTIPDFFNDHGVYDLYLAGNVDKTRLYDEQKRDHADSTVSGLLDRLPDKGDEYLIQAATQYLNSKGLTVRGLDELFGDRLMPEGHLAGPEPSQSARSTLDVLKPIARRLADAEVGQTVIGKDQSVVAVEAVEGTAATIERAGRLAGRGTVMLKSARSDQDARFDLPVVGADTVEQLSSAGASLLAVESARVLWLQQEQSRELAEEAGVTILGFRHPRPGMIRRWLQWLIE